MRETLALALIVWVMAGFFLGIEALIALVGNF